MKVDLPLGVTKILNKITEAGYRADVVGGAVRDMFLCRPTNDYDVTTDATPDVVKEIFRDERTIDTGIKHGTVTVLLDGVGYEVTTYRRDGEYKDSRHPESVTFTTSLTDDLSRRDFTVNAMAYNPRDGFTDPFGGKEDIESKTIRTVGDASLRFSEDALRIIRALRFASTLGFGIEEGTRVGIKETCQLLSNVSVERIYVEVYKLLTGDAAFSVIGDFPEVMSVILPEIDILLLPFGESDDPLVRLAAIFALNSESSSDAFDSAMRRLKTDNKSRETFRDALRVYTERSFATSEDVLISLRDFGEEAVLRALDIGVLVGRYGDSEKRLTESVLSSDIPYTVSMLAVGGRDLIALGIRGEAIGRALDKLLLDVITGKLPNEREALLLSVTEK